MTSLGSAVGALALGALAVGALTLGLGGAGCTRAPAPPPQSSARIKDSGPEKIAAQRAGARGLDLEADDQRWGIDAARERRRRAADKNAGSQPGGEIPGDGQADVRRGPSPASPGSATTK